MSDDRPTPEDGREPHGVVETLREEIEEVVEHVPEPVRWTVGKLAGANVVFDSQYTPPARNFNVDLSNASASQAFDYLAMLTHTFWKAISANTIFVTEDNVTKRRDYEDLRRVLAARDAIAA